MLIAIAAGMLFNLGVSVPLLASQAFHLGGGGYGALMAAFGIGAVPGAIAAASTSGHPTGTTIRRLTVLTAVAGLLTAVSPYTVLAFVGIGLSGFCSIWLIAIANTLVQLRSRPDMRGLIMGVWTMALPGSIPVTGLIAAFVGQVAGARASFGLTGVALLIAGAATWRMLGSDRRHDPGIDADVTVRGDRIEHPTIVRDQQQRARVGFQRRFQLLDRG